MRPGSPKAFLGTLILLAGTTAALAQAPGPKGGAGASFNSTAFGNIMVYLRTENGQGLPQTATPVIRISSMANGVPLPNVPSQVGDGWMFTGVAIGDDYEVQVTALGYLPARETVGVPNSPGATSAVVVSLRSVDQELVFHRPTGQFILAPRAEKEIQHALQDLQSGRIASAQKHTQKAIDLAPSNPYVQYVMGMTYLLSNHLKDAQGYFEKAVSIDAGHTASLTALGTVRYRLGDSIGAVDVLTRALQLDTHSWKAEWLLAASYLDQK